MYRHSVILCAGAFTLASVLGACGSSSPSSSSSTSAKPKRGFSVQGLTVRCQIGGDSTVTMPPQGGGTSTGFNLVTQWRTQGTGATVVPGGGGNVLDTNGGTYSQ